MKPLITSAAKFAEYAHAGQVRRYTNDPYFTHVEAVAKLTMQARGATSEMVAAAYLHDVVEDTSIRLDQIERKYGALVAAYVGALTEKKWPEPRPNRAYRVAYERDRLALTSPGVQTIKLADLIDNSATIVDHDPAFARVYLREKLALLGVLTSGDQGLWERAMDQVTEGLKRCG